MAALFKKNLRNRLHCILNPFQKIPHSRVSCIRAGRSCAVAAAVADNSHNLYCIVFSDKQTTSRISATRSLNGTVNGLRCSVKFRVCDETRSFRLPRIPFGLYELFQNGRHSRAGILKWICIGMCIWKTMSCSPKR